MRMTEEEIVEEILLMRALLESSYSPDKEEEMDHRLMAIINYLSKCVQLLSDAMYLKGMAEVQHVDKAPSKIKILCHNEYRLVEIVDRMEKTLTKAQAGLITQISKWKEVNRPVK